MEKEIEVWKDIQGYEGLYQVSNLGNVKSLSRLMISNTGRFTSRERFLKQCNDINGYLMVNLNKNNKHVTKKVHKLVAIEFLSHVPCGSKLVINHIDFNMKNNRVDNLEIVTTRENSNRKHIKSSSQYTGVCFHKKANKWVSQIHINGKLKYLGIYKKEIDASIAYEKALKLITQPPIY